MPDAKTIQRTIGKRVADMPGVVDLTAVTVTDFRDAVGLGVALTIDYGDLGLARPGDDNVQRVGACDVFPMTFRLPRPCRRADVLNACDRIAEAVKVIRRRRLSVEDYIREAKVPVLSTVEAPERKLIV